MKLLGHPRGWFGLCKPHQKQSKSTLKVTRQLPMDKECEILQISFWVETVAHLFLCSLFVNTIAFEYLCFNDTLNCVHCHPMYSTILLWVTTPFYTVHLCLIIPNTKIINLSNWTNSFFCILTPMKEMPRFWMMRTFHKGMITFLSNIVIHLKQLGLMA